MKFIVAACMAVAASAQFDLSQYLLLDSMTGHHGYYGHGPFGGDFLPLLAFGGLNGGAMNQQGLSDYLLFDQLSHHSGHYSGHHDYLPLLLSGNTAQFQDMVLLDTLSHNSHGDFLPMAVLSGQTSIGTDPTLTNLWALNEFGGGHHSDFSDLATLSAFGGFQGQDLTNVWGMQQVINGHDDHVLPLLAATGQGVPQDFTTLWALDQAQGHHSYYPRRHYGYRRPHTAARPVTRPVAQRPVARPVAQRPVARPIGQPLYPERVQAALGTRVQPAPVQPAPVQPEAQPAN